MQVRVTVKVRQPGFSAEQARAVADRVGGEAKAGVTTRAVSCVVAAESVEDGIQTTLERIQTALGAEAVTGELVEWRGEEIVTPRWKSRRVMVGDSSFGPLSRPGPPPGSGSAGVREPRRPRPGGGDAAAGRSATTH